MADAAAPEVTVGEGRPRNNRGCAGSTRSSSVGSVSVVWERRRWRPSRRRPWWTTAPAAVIGVISVVLAVVAERQVVPGLVRPTGDQPARPAMAVASIDDPVGSQMAELAGQLPGDARKSCGARYDRDLTVPTGTPSRCATAVCRSRPSTALLQLRDRGLQCGVRSTAGGSPSDRRRPAATSSVGTTPADRSARPAPGGSATSAGCVAGRRAGRPRPARSWSRGTPAQPVHVDRGAPGDGGQPVVDPGPDLSALPSPASCRRRPPRL